MLTDTDSKNAYSVKEMIEFIWSDIKEIKMDYRWDGHAWYSDSNCEIFLTNNGGKMKTFLTLIMVMLLGLTMAWGQEYKADVTGLDSLMVICDITTDCQKMWHIPFDYYTPKISHIPDYEYFEIVEKCDTIWVEEYVLINPDPYFNLDAIYILVEPLYKKIRYVDEIVCHSDTIWADKIPVYLTPDEYERLKLLLNIKPDTGVCEVFVKPLLYEDDAIWDN